jgi:hypothetical protein
MIVQHGLVNSGPPGDLVNPGAPEALFGEDLGGGLDDPLSRRMALVGVPFVRLGEPFVKGSLLAPSAPVGDGV